MVRLEEIVENKQREIREFKDTHGDSLHTGSAPAGPGGPNRFRGALQYPDRLGIIAEVKRMSPSRGKLNSEESPLDLATLYAETGADAISVLTDRKYFGGSFEFLDGISRTVAVPTLCKDFVLDPIQIDLASLSGASAILLITEILNDRELLSLFEHAGAVGLECLVESHHPDNIRRAVALGSGIIGINNRNLFTFEESLDHSLGWVHLIPGDRCRLSLSSIQSRQDAQRVAEAGFDGVLIGTALMRAFNKRAAVNSFRDIPKPDRC